MSEPVGSVTQTQAAAQVADVREKAPEARPQPVPTDKVELSSAAQAALRKTAESPPVESTKDADADDMQAKQLLATEAAAKEATAASATKHTAHVVA